MMLAVLWYRIILHRHRQIKIVKFTFIPLSSGNICRIHVYKSVSYFIYLVFKKNCKIVSSWNVTIDSFTFHLTLHLKKNILEGPKLVNPRIYFFLDTNEVSEESGVGRF